MERLPIKYGQKISSRLSLEDTVATMAVFC